MTDDSGHGLKPLRIALVAPPMKSVPPVGYGGTERVVAALAEGLDSRGHDVTVFASGDSEIGRPIEPIVPAALWDAGFDGDVTYHCSGGRRVWDRSSTLRHHPFPPREPRVCLLARYCPTPVVSTLHGRLDIAGLPELLLEFARHPACGDQRRTSVAGCPI